MKFILGQGDGERVFEFSGARVDPVDELGEAALENESAAAGPWRRCILLLSA